jgi:hypothetical protein
MIETLVFTLAVATNALSTTPTPGGDRMVVLADAYGFGVTHAQALANYRASVRHHDQCANTLARELPPLAFDTWNDGMWRRRLCWLWLSDALDERLPRRERLYWLDWVRRTVGDDAYFARRVIPPIPSYAR